MCSCHKKSPSRRLSEQNTYVVMRAGATVPDSGVWGSSGSVYASSTSSISSSAASASCSSARSSREPSETGTSCSCRPPLSLSFLVPSFKLRRNDRLMKESLDADMLGSEDGRDARFYEKYVSGWFVSIHKHDSWSFVLPLEPYVVNSVDKVSKPMNDGFHRATNLLWPSFH